MYTSLTDTSAGGGKGMRRAQSTDLVTIDGLNPALSRPTVLEVDVVDEECTLGVGSPRATQG